MKKEMLEKLHNSNENKVIVGDINIGKTGNVLLPLVDSMIDSEENLFIIDSKEEYYKTYSEKLKKNGYNTIVINLRDVNKSDCWNFLDYPKKLYSSGNIDLATDFIEKMGHELFYEDNKNSDPFWSNSASDFFSGVVLGLFEDAKDDEINLNSVYDVFNVGEKKFASDTFVKRYFSMKDTTNPAYVCASGTAFAPNETRASILSVAKQKLRVYVSREALANVLANTSFDFEKLTDKKTAVFIITKDENKTVNIIATMFLQQLYRLILQNKTNVKWNFVLDNFDTLYNVSNLVEILSSAVSRNINFYIATRSFDTLRENCGDYIKHIASILTVGSDNITIEKNGNIETVDKGESSIDNDLYFRDDVEYPATVKNQISV